MKVVQFHNNCPNCNALCETNMKMTGNWLIFFSIYLIFKKNQKTSIQTFIQDIPFFKSVIIMCTICESCGIRSSEVKSGSGIEEKGIKYTLKLTDPSDLNRDLLKVKFFKHLIHLIRQKYIFKAKFWKKLINS